MKPWGYGVVALVMADAWGEEATQHVRRGHIFGASCPLWLPIYALLLPVVCQTNMLQNFPLTITEPPS